MLQPSYLRLSHSLTGSACAKLLRFLNLLRAARRALRDLRGLYPNCIMKVPERMSLISAADFLICARTFLFIPTGAEEKGSCNRNVFGLISKNAPPEA